MPDLYGPEVRSWVMSRIRKADTRPELQLRKLLWAAGLRGYRIRPRLPGTPDVTFGKARLAIFVDGCFWHACSRCAIPAPRSNVSYWLPKIARTLRRDRRVRRQLRSLGWATITIREHQLLSSPEGCLRRIQQRLQKLLRTKRHRRSAPPRARVPSR